MSSGRRWRSGPRATAHPVSVRFPDQKCHRLNRVYSSGCLEFGGIHVPGGTECSSTCPIETRRRGARDHYSVPVNSEIAWSGLGTFAGLTAYRSIQEAPMYCTSCGTQLQDTANYCSECGRQTARAGVGAASSPAALPAGLRQEVGRCLLRHCQVPGCRRDADPDRGRGGVFLHRRLGVAGVHRCDFHHAGRLRPAGSRPLRGPRHELA